ncbi:MAG TPA: pimeloyl-[acyl-carrier protein] methyl ester esterase [Gammaproteobacteria bacterium]|nr:pimeloyl-[acyl-carrier protein] methyl ester esterase [Gammaproteobacteria bacterium]
MTLHVDRLGKGPDVVLLHGWAMHGGLLSAWARQLARAFRVHVVDLPGHGYSAFDGEREIGEWAAAVAGVVPAGANWIGWSLGGLVALAALALEEARIQRLVLLASTPRFCAAAGWPHAVDPEVLAQFAVQLERDPERTLGRFLSLQVRNSQDAGDSLRALRAALRQRPPAHPQALRQGLALLRDSDLRQALIASPVPLYRLLGERDTLVPAVSEGPLARMRTVVIAGAGHAPFLSHPRACSEAVQCWFSAVGEVSDAAP